MLARTLLTIIALCMATAVPAHPAQDAHVPLVPVPARTTVPEVPAPPAADDATRALVSHLLLQQAQQAHDAAQAAQTLKDQVESLRPGYTDKIITGVVAILSALIGAGIGALSGYVLQRERVKHDRQAARQAAGMKEVSEIKQFRGRQLNEFYAPLEALLKQGLIVRNELYVRLKATTQAGVVFSEMPDADAANGWSLGIAIGGEDARAFRLLDDLPLLQATFPEVMGTVGETVRINQLIVKLIHDKVGLVLHGSDTLSQQLGTFLAHQSVLEDMYKTVKKNRTAVVPKYTTTFPRKLQRLVSDDCLTLRRELQTWEAKVTAWTDDIGASNGTVP